MSQSPKAATHGLDVIEYLGIRIERKRNRASRDGRRLELTAAQLRLLEYFLSRPRATLTRTELLEAVTEGKAIVSKRTLDVHVCALRHALGLPELIQTIRGVGYCLEARPESVEPQQDLQKGETR